MLDYNVKGTQQHTQWHKKITQDLTWKNPQWGKQPRDKSPKPIHYQERDTTQSTSSTSRYTRNM